MIPVTYQTAVEGMPVVVVDGLLAPRDLERTLAFLSLSSYSKSESARGETQEFKHWALNVPPESMNRLPLLGPTEAVLAEHFTRNGPWRLYRSYCNVAQYGDMLFSHSDCLPDQIQLTALWYLAKDWNMEWGGETLFFDEAGDARAVVSPKPGRLSVFDGRIRHVGRPPNRICFVPRYTFALKFERLTEAGTARAEPVPVR
ncbi:MAG: 2OG-Fe(II) oxygenase [Gammaproteobacteria bacterium]